MIPLEFSSVKLEISMELLLLQLLVVMFFEIQKKIRKKPIRYEKRRIQSNQEIIICFMNS